MSWWKFWAKSKPSTDRDRVEGFISDLERFSTSTTIEHSSPEDVLFILADLNFFGFNEEAERLQRRAPRRNDTSTGDDVLDQGLDLIGMVAFGPALPHKGMENQAKFMSHEQIARVKAAFARWETFSEPQVK